MHLSTDIVPGVQALAPRRTMTSLCAAARAPPALAASASARLPRSSRRAMVVCAAQGEQAAARCPPKASATVLAAGRRVLLNGSDALSIEPGCRPPAGRPATLLPPPALPPPPAGQLGFSLLPPPPHCRPRHHGQLLHRQGECTARGSLGSHSRLRPVKAPYWPLCSALPACKLFPSPPQPHPLRPLPH